MEIVKRNVSDLKAAFQQHEKEAHIRSLTQRWIELGAKEGTDVSHQQLRKLLKRAKRAVPFILATSPQESTEFHQLLTDEYYFLRFIKNLTCPNDLLYTAGWLNMHVQIADRLVSEHGLFTISTPGEIKLPDKFPPEYLRLTGLDHIEAFRRRIAIKKTLVGIELLSNKPDLISNPELSHTKDIDQPPPTEF
jgi:hypothetical protein